MLKKFPFKFPRLPLPGPLGGPLGGPLLDLVIEGAKKVWDVFTSGNSSKEISEREKLNEENVADVIDYNKLLNEFTKDIEEDISKLEEKILAELTEYHEELIFLIDAVEQSKDINLHSKSLKRNMEKLKRDSKGNLLKGIQRQISLDNSELKKILILPAGDLKKDRIQAFKENLIKLALSDFISDVKSIIEDFSDDVSDELNEVISSMRKDNETLLEELSAIENSKEKDEVNIKAVIELAELKGLLSDEILKVAKEG